MIIWLISPHKESLEKVTAHFLLELVVKIHCDVNIWLFHFKFMQTSLFTVKLYNRNISEETKIEESEDSEDVKLFL